MAQYAGTVKWFNNAKGYGFLCREVDMDVSMPYDSIGLDGCKGTKEGDPLQADGIRDAKKCRADQKTLSKRTSKL